MALVAHVFAATGAPVPMPRLFHANASSTPYPCREHVCGCLNADQCWAGDCCCFTLEQKLAWADARGIEPPAHVRPAVEAKKARQTPAKPKSSCCESEREPAAEPSCCERESAKDAVGESASIRWAGGIFTQKCRGEGPAGLLKLEQTAPPPLTSEHSATPEPEGFVRVASVPAVITSQSPPIRPPRLV
ncbi:MAG: hypothetical protein C0467_08835 [Planctomycetaceae bacterium]|nr:hypothetical protein [Planctomycetaceae bacterium]